jgi:hypothetical protein
MRGIAAAPGPCAFSRIEQSQRVRGQGQRITAWPDHEVGRTPCPLPPAPLEIRTSDQQISTYPVRSALLRPLLAATLLLAGCAQVPRRPSPSPELRLAPAAFGASLSLQQRLTVSHGARTQRADALLEVDGNSLRLVLLVGPKRMLTLVFDGESVAETRDPALPETLAGERFIDDIQLAYWPAAAVRTVLPPGWTLDESPLRRTLRQDGAAAVEVRYSQTTRWLGHIEIHHLRQDYRLTIDSAALP